MASASGFLSLSSVTKKKKYRRRTGKQINLPSLSASASLPTTLTSPLSTSLSQTQSQPRPHSRGHTIHGTDDEISFGRARQMLRMINEDTPPKHHKRRPKRQRQRTNDRNNNNNNNNNNNKDNYYNNNLYNNKIYNKDKKRYGYNETASTSKTTRTTNQTVQRYNTKSNQRKKSKNDTNGINSLISDVWSLQPNKPEWMAERPPTTEPIPVVIRAETPMEDLSSPLPNDFDSPVFLNKVQKKLRLNPNASHLEKSLLDLHLSGADNADGEGMNNEGKVLQWLNYRYPLLLQRDRFRENKAVVCIGKAWRSYQSRVAFHSMYTIVQIRNGAALLLQNWIRKKQRRILEKKIAYEMTPTVVVTLTRRTLEKYAKAEIYKREQIELDILYKKEREQERLLKQSTGLSKMQREKREKAAITIQLQWSVHNWRLKNDLFFMYQRIRHNASKKIQQIYRLYISHKKLMVKKEKRWNEINQKWSIVFNSAVKIQKLCRKIRGKKWRSRMTHCIDVRDLLGADEDLPWEPEGIVDEFLETDMGNMNVLNEHYTGGVFSEMGAFRPNTNLTEGQRWMRVRDAVTSLASVYHSVGKLQSAEKHWQSLVEGSLVTELEARSTRGNGSLRARSEKGNDRHGDKNEDEDENYDEDDDDDDKQSGKQLLIHLLKDGPERQMNGRTISFLIHLCLVWQCRGYYERAERLLANDILGKEYEKMMVKVRLANAFRRKNLLTTMMNKLKKECAEMLWKREHAARLFKQRLLQTLFRYYWRWSQWSRAGYCYRMRLMRKKWKKWKKFVKDMKILRKMMGDSHTHNVVATKRSVLRRWWYQTIEWKKQRSTMNVAFNHGRMIVMNDKFIVWKRWHKIYGKPWWISKNKFNGLFYYWENIVRLHLLWWKRIIFLEKDEGIEWGTRWLQKTIRGKWGRKKAKRQIRYVLVNSDCKKCWSGESVVVLNARCSDESIIVLEKFSYYFFFLFFLFF